MPQKQRLTESTLATIYGCCGLFDMCADQDLMSLSFEGTSKFLDWLGWERTNICVVKKSFITWVRPEYTGGRATAGYLADPCAEPNSVQWGECDFTLEDWGRLRRAGPVRDITKTDVRYCEAQPRYRLDGSPISDDREYDMVIATEVLLQDLKRLIVTGNGATGGQFDGLQQLVATGYVNSAGRRCEIMDSIVVDWNSNGTDGGAGVTWNGNAVAATFNLVDVLLAIYRRIVQRISWAPPLAARGLAVGDIAIVMPTGFIDCLLNAYTCWRVCDGGQYDETVLNSLEGRQFRDTLNGGMFGAGRIFLHGFEVPIIPYDWGLINGPTTFDMYVLTGQVGAIKLVQGQYNDMAPVTKARPDRYYTDGGRLLTWSDDDETCERQVVEMQPRLLCWAPWAQARIQNVRCATVAGPLSPDPTDTSFFPESSFSVAACP